MLFQPKVSIGKFLHKNVGLEVIDILAFAGIVFIGLAIVSNVLEGSNVTISITSRKLHSY